MLETGVVAGLDKDKFALPLLIPTAECARETWIGRDMCHHDPGTSARGRLWRPDGFPEAGDEAIPEASHDHFLAASHLEIDPAQQIL